MSNIESIKIGGVNVLARDDGGVWIGDCDLHLSDDQVHSLLECLGYMGYDMRSYTSPDIDENGSPQAELPPGEWMSHAGPIRIANMSDEYLVNRFKTCRRHSNPKAEHLLSHIIDRGLQHRVRGTE